MSEQTSPVSEFAELLVMLKAQGKESDIEPLAQAVNAKIIEITKLFEKVVAILSIPTKEVEPALKILQADSRVEIAQINTTHKHC